MSAAKALLTREFSTHHGKVVRVTVSRTKSGPDINVSLPGGEPLLACEKHEIVTKFIPGLARDIAQNLEGTGPLPRPKAVFNAFKDGIGVGTMEDIVAEYNAQSGVGGLFSAMVPILMIGTLMSEAPHRHIFEGPDGETDPSLAAILKGIRALK
jgi:hypothetical protein